MDPILTAIVAVLLFAAVIYAILRLVWRTAREQAEWDREREKWQKKYRQFEATIAALKDRLS